MSRMSRWSLYWPFPRGWWPAGAVLPSYVGLASITATSKQASITATSKQVSITATSKQASITATGRAE